MLAGERKKPRKAAGSMWRLIEGLGRELSVLLTRWRGPNGGFLAASAKHIKRRE